MKITRQVFIDANIFTYLLTGHPVYGRSCQNLLEKVERGDIEAFISPLVIEEVSYVLMVQTARKTVGPQDARSIKNNAGCLAGLPCACGRVSWLSRSAYLQRPPESLDPGLFHLQDCSGMRQGLSSSSEGCLAYRLLQGIWNKGDGHK